jgi:hypothetical protein
MPAFGKLATCQNPAQRQHKGNVRDAALEFCGLTFAPFALKPRFPIVFLILPVYLPAAALVMPTAPMFPTLCVTMAVLLMLPVMVAVVPDGAFPPRIVLVYQDKVDRCLTGAVPAAVTPPVTVFVQRYMQIDGRNTISWPSHNNWMRIHYRRRCNIAKGYLPKNTRNKWSANGYIDISLRMRCACHSG